MPLPLFRTALALSACALVLSAPRAEACGCFAPPNPTVPVVQAGERILFVVKNGRVTAHVQLQFDGATGSEFAWLLPMPAVPTLSLGVDELFVRLTNATQPRYSNQVVTDSSCFSGTGGGSAASAAGGAAGGGSSGFGVDAGAPVVVLVQDTVGPYDYAVLRADTATEMLEWLRVNRYFVPASTDAAVAPYVRPGAFFLALKLRAGASAGDLQPVVLEYDGDVGQIPLTLTSVGASPNMPVEVWMVGPGRAIPRNFYHVVLNDAALDWASFGSNYRDLVTRAVATAPGKKAFVTEFAGSTERLRDTLAPASRFGTQAELAAQTTPQAFLRYLYDHGFGTSSFVTPLALPTALRAILVRYLPPPPNINAETFFRNYSTYVLIAPPNTFDPVVMAEEIWTRIVKPTQAAQALVLSQPTLTKFFSTISAEDMNADPVFAFNPSLPEVSNEHRATTRVSCAGGTQNFMLETEQGWSVFSPGGRRAVALSSLPPALRLEVLREEGPPEVIDSAFDEIHRELQVPSNTPQPEVPAGAEARAPVAHVCSVAPGAGVLLGLALLLVRRRRAS